jgi:glycosyltransferase involved in cell wall biosynthesis
MSTVSLPLVCVLTPVHNAGEYLAECIESVLSQTYSNWHYIIVDNCSTDDSLKIAQGYADKDPRIRVLSTERQLGTYSSHNDIVRRLVPESKYCKIIFAEDWIYPNCIAEMVRLAEEHPTIGLVGAYTMDGRAVLWQGPPHSINPIPGKDVCRGLLMGGPYVLGSMTSLLIRSDLIRKSDNFFEEQSPHREIGACFDVLRESDYGYIHQILSFSRPGKRTTEAFTGEVGTCALGSVIDCLKYGPVFLDAAEYPRQLRRVRWDYHRVLATNLFGRSKQCWRFHQERLAAAGSRIDWNLLVFCVLLKVLSRLSRPLHSARDAGRWGLRVIFRSSPQVTAPH